MTKKKYNPSRSYYVVVSNNKVQFLGSCFWTVTERANDVKDFELHRHWAESYREAAFYIAQMYDLQLSDEVQRNIGLLRGFKHGVR